MAHWKVETRRNNVKIITVNPDRCTGCRLCELACSLKNTGEFNPARSRIRVIGFEELFCLPVTCFQCERPYCAEVCPAGAIIRDEATGMVKVTEEKCTGCKICTLACPFGNIAFSSEEKTAVKCELCGGEPECVLFCPTRALEFREADTAMIYKQRSLSEKIRGIYEGIK
jgi:carbon-monoxide dehydrogenase iron sulfur subunit